MTKVPAYLAKKEKPAIAEDKLSELRGMVANTRDLEVSKARTEEALKAVNEQLNDMYFRQLPDFMDGIGIKKLTIEGDGDLPAFEAEAKPYHRANIAADWPEEKRAAAFAWLEENGHGDLIKTQYVIHLPRDERDKAKELEHMLAEAGYAFECSLSIPWNTLSAWLKEQVEKHETPPLDLIGGQVGRVVKLKRKD